MRKTIHTVYFQFWVVALFTLAVILLPNTSWAQSVADDLKEIEKLETFQNNPLSNRKGVRFYLAEYAQAKKNKKDKDALNGACLNLGIQYMQLGNSDSANYFLNQISDERLSASKPENEVFQAGIFGLLALAKWDQGKGARETIIHLKNALLLQPNNLAYLWLYNLAHRKQGTYPTQIATTQLIDLEKFDLQYPNTFFQDVAANNGLGFESNLGGVIMEDFNDDGIQDIFATSFNLDQSVRLMLQNEEGEFSDVTEKAGLADIKGGNHAIQADFNNDTYMDILVLRGGWVPDFFNRPNSLLRNNGDGTFTDITRESGFLSYHPSQTAAFADFNKDGFLDIFIGNEYEKDNSVGDHFCELFINNNGSNFEDRAAKSGIKLNELVKGVIAFDYDNDGWEDIYVSCLNVPNKLYRNKGIDKKGNVQFEEVGVKARVEGPPQSVSLLQLDANNDGWMDLMVGAMDLSLEKAAEDYRAEKPTGEFRPHFYLNQKDGTFQEVGKSMNLKRSIFTLGLNAIDFDNDSYLDIYASTGGPGLDMLLPNVLMRNAAGKNFQEITKSTQTGHLQKCHGSAVGDLNGDGNPDLYQNVGGWYEGDSYSNSLFLNPGTQFAALVLKLEGVTSNRSAIGARATVTVSDGDKIRDIHRRVGEGGSYSGNSLILEIGLGKVTKIQKVTIHWPASGKTQVFSDMEQGKAYFVKEDMENHLEYFIKGTSLK